MFFAAGSATTARETYSAMLEAARTADRIGLAAVWTPERHFDEFGGIYPNPALTSAALATVTSRVQLRAGSLISPLHQTIRIAEEWSVVDNLSQGRVGVSFGSGWNANDFVLAPENYGNRRQMVLEQIETVRRLWRGETLKLRNGTGQVTEVELHPAPVQPELPIWLTSSGSPETFAQAGAAGANLLTHLIGQDLAQLATKIELYRATRAGHGHDPAAGTVSLMLHTHLDADQDAAVARSRIPFREYLRSAVRLERSAAGGGGTISGGMRLPDDEIPPDLIEELLDVTYERYLATGSLIGSPKHCTAMVGRAADVGVDEIACLVDFGVPVGAMLAALPAVAELAELAG
jgi:natural product biosynthesis luciferase-like monooxygenase protein